jgi:hypothetical protein
MFQCGHVTLLIRTEVVRVRAGCGLRICQGRRGLARPFWMPVHADFESEMGKCAAFALGAVSPMIEAAVVLVDVLLGLANTKTS